MIKGRLIGLLLLGASLAMVGCDSDGGGILDPNTQHIPLNGGVFNYQNGRFVLNVPANSISAASNVTVDTATNYPADARVIASTAFRATANNGATFSTGNPARLRIQYPDLVGVNENDFRIYKVEGNDWVLLNNQEVFAGSNTVEARITSLGTFAVLVGEPVVEPTIFRTVLSPGQETGVVAGSDLAAFGTATVTIPDSGGEIGVNIVSSGLTNVSAAHIHRGRLGESGPIAATLYVTSMGEFTSPYSKTVTAVDLNTGVVANMAELISLIQNNNAYINIHTTANAGGAIRGQLGNSVTLEATLNGGQEVPSNESTAEGTASVVFNRDMTEFTVMVDSSGFGSNVTAAHIHAGSFGELGGVIFPLFMGSGGTTFTVNRTLTSADFTATAGVDTFNQAVAAMLGLGAYVNVHTEGIPSGEIRGQFIPLLLE